VDEGASQEDAGLIITSSSLLFLDSLAKARAGMSCRLHSTDEQNEAQTPSVTTTFIYNRLKRSGGASLGYTPCSLSTAQDDLFVETMF